MLFRGGRREALLDAVADDEPAEFDVFGVVELS